TDIRAYNSKHLDVMLRVPSGYLHLEEKIKKRIAEHIARGRMEVKIQIKDQSEGAIVFEVDHERVRAIQSALTELKNEFGLHENISLELLMSIGGIIRQTERVAEAEIIWPVIEVCLTAALKNLEVMQKKEGDFMAADLLKRLDYLDDCIGEIEKDSDGLLTHYQHRLKERLGALTHDMVEIEPGRLAQEAAFLADRSDISEEIVRVKSHVQQFRHIMNSEEPGGRKLNFLLQELHREFNTMGSKIGQADAAHRIVDVKSELEKIREQIQNVE
ncbi:MAG: YicC/YloC family endoribonuclease, partial [Desulfobacterales bacterium]